MEATTTGTSSLDPLGSPRAIGLAVLRVYANLRAVAPCPAHATLDTTWRAGRAADLALRIRRQGRIPFGAVESFGELVTLSRLDLIDWALPCLSVVEIVDYALDTEGSPTTIEERVGVAAPVLEQVAAIWEVLKPSASERCAVSSADHAAYCPMTESEHRAVLELQGYPAEIHERVFQALKAIGLLQRAHSTALRENVIWAPYVWGTKALDVAQFMKQLPPNEREALSSLSRKAAERPGVSIDDLGAEQKLVSAARHAGLFDATRVLAGSNERAFAFSPGLESGIRGGLTDATHERKLFVAHILNGHRFGRPGTGRIDHPVALVNALINKKSVGPTTAARTEYGLLEGAGIVRAEEVGGGKAMLHLVKSDVAEESLELLRLAIDEDPSQQADSVEKLWIPGSAMTTPEQDRHRIPEPVGDEREIVQSTVERLRDEIGQSTRGENIHG
jgi:hypothetical protein